MSGLRLAQHRRKGWQILAVFQVSAKSAAAIETDVLKWWRGALGLPSYLTRDHMPQGGWTETAAAGRVDLAATVTRICNLAVASPPPLTVPGEEQLSPSSFPPSCPPYPGCQRGRSGESRWPERQGPVQPGWCRRGLPGLPAWEL